LFFWLPAEEKKAYPTRRLSGHPTRYCWRHGGAIIRRKRKITKSRTVAKDFINTCLYLSGPDLKAALLKSLILLKMNAGRDMRNNITFSRQNKRSGSPDY